MGERSSSESGAPAAASPAAKRSFTVDALKGFAICCVVLGHAVLRNVPDPPSSPLYLTLSAFEMPLFMFLSGYVLPGRVRSPRWRWVGDRALRLMVPFFAWQAIFYLSLRVLEPESFFTAQTLEGLGRNLIRVTSGPTAGLWYLPALLLCSAMLAGLYSVREHPIVILMAGWIGFLLLSQVREQLGIEADYGLLKATTYWVFFAAGFAYKQLGYAIDLHRARRAWPLLTFPLWAAPVASWSAAAGVAVAALSKIALGLIGTGFSVVLMNVGEKLARAAKLDRIGRMSLGIYCSHWLFLRVEFTDGAVGAAASFVFSLTCAAAVAWLVAAWGPTNAVLLGGWPRRKATAR